MRAPNECKRLKALQNFARVRLQAMQICRRASDWRPFSLDPEMVVNLLCARVGNRPSLRLQFLSAEPNSAFPSFASLDRNLLLRPTRRNKGNQSNVERSLGTIACRPMRLSCCHLCISKNRPTPCMIRATSMTSEQVVYLASSTQITSSLSHDRLQDMIQANAWESWNYNRPKPASLSTGFSHLIESDAQTVVLTECLQEKRADPL